MPKAIKLKWSAELDAALNQARASFKKVHGQEPTPDDVDQVIESDATGQLVKVHKTSLKNKLKAPLGVSSGSSINSLLAASSSKPVLLGSNGQPLGLGRLGVDEFHYLLTGKVPPQKTPLPPKVLPPSVNEAKIDSDEQDTSFDQLYRVIPLEESYLIQVSIIAGHTAKFAVAADAFGIEVSMTPKNLSPYLYTKDGLQASEFKNDLQSQAILASFQAEPLPTIEFVIPLDKKVCNVKYTPTRFVYEKIGGGDWIDVTKEREGGESNVWRKKNDAVYFPMPVGFIVTADVIQDVVVVAKDDVNDFYE
ncbi:hypothetical protein BDR26DRAFT_926986 [Obelidium mucronatum]|nr:hypothetical protein BDR26DRAFT_926986 [Obelidium mucronatum]